MCNLWALLLIFIKVNCSLDVFLSIFGRRFDNSRRKSNVWTRKFNFLNGKSTNSSKFFIKSNKKRISMQSMANFRISMQSMANLCYSTEINVISSRKNLENPTKSWISFDYSVQKHFCFQFPCEMLATKPATIASKLQNSILFTSISLFVYFVENLHHLQSACMAYKNQSNPEQLAIYSKFIEWSASVVTISDLQWSCVLQKRLARCALFSSV